jgi:hypothetical protein
LAHNGATLTHSTDLALTRLAGSEPLPCFLPVDCYTRLHLPCGGSLGPQFPTFPVGFHRPSILCSAKTANSPSRWRSLFAIPHRYLACPFSFRVSGLAPGLVREVGRPLRTPGILWVRPSHNRFSGKETIGSPEFPGYPRQYMIGSQTPVVTLNTCLDAFRSAAFQLLHTVGLPLSIQVYPLTTTIHFFGAQYRSCILDPPGFGLPLPGLPAGFSTARLAKL